MCTMHKQRTSAARLERTINTKVPMTGKVRREPGGFTLLWLWRVLLAQSQEGISE